ncbi:hypothetical protein AALP_AAs66840U000100, partial [Arabis alpina]
MIKETAVLSLTGVLPHRRDPLHFVLPYHPPPPIFPLHLPTVAACETYVLLRNATSASSSRFGEMTAHSPERTSPPPEPPDPPDLISTSPSHSSTVANLHHRLVISTTPLDLNGTRPRSSSSCSRCAISLSPGGSFLHHSHASVNLPRLPSPPTNNMAVEVPRPSSLVMKSEPAAVSDLGLRVGFSHGLGPP